MALEEHHLRAFAELTDKQRQALNLLIQHKTSKEISKLLGVSPHTVDQRIESAKRKFRVSSRGALAQAYRSSLPIGEQMTYEESHMSAPRVDEDSSISDELDAVHGLLDRNWSKPAEPTRQVEGYRVTPELFDGPSGTLYRLMTIVIIAVMLIFAVLGGASIFVTMSEIWGH